MKLKQVLFASLFIATALFWGCNSKEDSGKGSKGKGKFSIEKAGEMYEEVIQEGVYYEEESTTPQGTVVSQVWMKGDKIKRITPSQNMAMIINGDKITSYDTSTKQGYIISDEGDDPEDAETDDMEPANYYEDMNEDVVTSEEEYNGIKCVVSEVTTEESKVKVWIDKKTGFFIRIEMLSEGSLISNVENKNIKYGGIDDSEFEVPSDVVITDMNSLFEQMEGSMDLLEGGLGEGLF